MCPVRIAALGAIALAAVTAGCGYSVAGRSDLLPDTIQTIAVPAFGNLTTRYKLSDRLPAAITREFITRTRYQVVSEPDDADAVLQGAVTNYISFPTIFDQATGRASGVQMSVYLQISLVDRSSGAVLYTQPNMEFRQRYEISTDQIAYFEESDVALTRLSQDVARTLVSSILEYF